MDVESQNSLLLWNNTFGDIFEAPNENKWNISGPFSCLYSFYIVLYSAQESAEQNET